MKTNLNIVNLHTLQPTLLVDGKKIITHLMYKWPDQGQIRSKIKTSHVRNPDSEITLMFKCLPSVILQNA